MHLDSKTIDESQTVLQDDQGNNIPIIIISNQDNPKSIATATETLTSSGYVTGSEDENLYSALSEFNIIDFLKSDIIGQAILV